MLIWKEPIRITEFQLLALCSTPQESHHVPERVVKILRDLCQAWRCDHFPEEPVPVLNHSLGDGPFLNIQPKPPLIQLHAVSLSPVSGHETEEISMCPSASFFW